MLITKPSSLSSNALSESSHITDIYDQLTDGTRSFNVNSAVIGNLITNSLTNFNILSKMWIKHLGQSGSIVGDYSENITNILSSNNYYAQDYKNDILVFNGIKYKYGYQYFSCLVISEKNINNTWYWNLLGMNLWN